VQDPPQLDALRDQLLAGLREELGPQDKIRAFERHQLLAIRFQRVARLNSPAKDDDGDGWRRYFREHFPRGDAHAHLLWHDWRTALLKDDAPGPGVAITHGQLGPHWTFVHPGQQLCINLESMWTDYEESVDHFIAACANDSILRQRALSRWVKHRWTVQIATYVAPDAYRLDVAAVSATHSATTMAI
jgi:hypothetical protein